MVAAALSLAPIAYTAQAATVGATVGAESSQRINIYAVDVGVTQFLNAVSVAAGVKIDVSDAVNGRIRRQDFKGPLNEVLDVLSTYSGLEWFRFNNVYYVSQSSEATSRVVRFGNLVPERAAEALEAAGIDSTVLSQTVMSGGEAIVLTGPPKLVAFAEVIIESIPDEQPLAERKHHIRERRGTVLTIEPVLLTAKPAGVQGSEKQGESN